MIMKRKLNLHPFTCLMFLGSIGHSELQTDSSKATQCADEVCNSVLCPVMELECYKLGGVIYPRSSGVCNCCIKCVIILKENELCNEKLLPDYDLDYVCDSELTCNKNTGKCVRGAGESSQGHNVNKASENSKVCAWDACSFIHCPFGEDQCKQANAIIHLNAQGPCNCCIRCVIEYDSGDFCGVSKSRSGIFDFECRWGWECHKEKKICVPTKLWLEFWGNLANSSTESSI